MDPLAALHGAANEMTARNVAQAAEHLFAYYHGLARARLRNDVLDARARILAIKLVDMLRGVKV